MTSPDGPPGIAVVVQRGPAGPVGQWLPDQPRAWQKVTLRQWLQHTSGVPDFSTSPAFLDALCALAVCAATA